MVSKVRIHLSSKYRYCKFSVFYPLSVTKKEGKKEKKEKNVWGELKV
jgi:hypothetical protein